MTYVFRGTCALFISLILTACLDVQLNGPVVGADVTITPLREPDRILIRGVTRDATAVIDHVGQASWDSYGPIARILWLGTAELTMDSLEDDALYLVTASGGVDVDANQDLLVDATPSPLGSDLHAIMTGEQLKHPFNARISTLTEAVYMYLLPELAGLSNAQLLTRLEEVAGTLVINTDAATDYDAVLAWSRNNTPQQHYTGVFNHLNSFAVALADGDKFEKRNRLGAIVIEGDADNDGISNGRDGDADNDGLLNENDPYPLLAQRIGRFVDAPVKGLGYRSATFNGRTGSDGAFDYVDGEETEFRIGNLILGSSDSGSLLSPLNLYADAGDASDTRVNNILRLLQSLDRDCEPDNGIVLHQNVWTAGRTLSGPLPEAVFEFEESKEVATLLAASSCTERLVPAAAAQRHYQGAIEQEYADLLSEVSSLSDFSAGIDSNNAIVASDGSTLHVRPATSPGNAFIVLFQSGNTTMVFTLNDAGEPTSMTDDKGRTVIFDNATGTSIDSYTKLRQEETFERVAMTPEALAAYAALKALFISASDNVLVLAEPVWSSSPSLSSWISAGTKGLLHPLMESVLPSAYAAEQDDFWVQVYGALFTYAQAWDTNRQAGSSRAFTTLAASQSVRATQQATLYEIPLQSGQEPFDAIAREAGICPATESDCGTIVSDAVEEDLLAAVQRLNSLDRPTLLEQLAEELAGESNRTPVATLFYPLDGAAFGIGADIRFGGECVDAESDLDELKLSWQLNGENWIDGQTGFSTNGLTAGDHKIALRCEDERSATGSSQITIRVATAPEITGLSLPETVRLGETVEMRVFAENGGGGAVAQEDIDWHSSLDGFISSGSVVQFSPSITGSHEITVTVVNAAGVSASRSAPMTIDDNGRILSYLTTGVLAGPKNYDSDQVLGRCEYQVSSTVRLSVFMDVDNDGNGTGWLSFDGTGPAIETPLNGCGEISPYYTWSFYADLEISNWSSSGEIIDEPPDEIYDSSYFLRIDPESLKASINFDYAYARPSINLRELQTLRVITDPCNDCEL